MAAVAGIAYAVYRFFAPDYLEDFEEDFDDDFDDYLKMRTTTKTKNKIRKREALRGNIFSAPEIEDLNK